jgi:cytochrome P450
MFGGGDTTANVIMIGAFYMLKRPDLVKRLKDELKEHWPDLGVGKEPKLSVLEQMPFLVSVRTAVSQAIQTDLEAHAEDRTRSSKNLSGLDRAFLAGYPGLCLKAVPPLMDATSRQG